MFFNNPDIDYELFNLSQFTFIDEIMERNGYFKFSYFLSRLFFGNGWNFSPIVSRRNIHYKGSGKLNIPTYSKRISLQDCGKEIGFNEATQQKILGHYDRRLMWHNVVFFIVYMLLNSIYIFLLVNFHLFEPIKLNFFIYLGFLYLIATVFLGVSLRISEFVALRFFSDAMCIQSLIYLILELTRCKNPLTPSQKKQLITPTVNLANATHFVHNIYHLDPSTHQWAKNHFRQIEDFIREREKWIIAPSETTLDDLQQDFYHLASMFINGDFGNFKYEEKSEIQVDQPQNGLKIFFITFPRFLIGVMLPLSGLWIILYHKNIIPQGIDTNHRLILRGLAFSGD